MRRQLIDDIEAAQGDRLAIWRLIRDEQHRLGVGREARVLLWVYENGDRRRGYGEISHDLGGMPKSTVRYILNVLVDQGLIKRIPPPPQGKRRRCSYRVR